MVVRERPSLLIVRLVARNLVVMICIRRSGLMDVPRLFRMQHRRRMEITNRQRCYQQKLKDQP